MKPRQPPYEERVKTLGKPNLSNTHLYKVGRVSRPKTPYATYCLFTYPFIQGSESEKKKIKEKNLLRFFFSSDSVSSSLCFQLLSGPFDQLHLTADQSFPDLFIFVLLWAATHEPWLFSSSRFLPHKPQFEGVLFCQMTCVRMNPSSKGSFSLPKRRIST